MTLLKFAVTLLSTMVVAVNHSSEPANSLAFAQQDKEKNLSEEDFELIVDTMAGEAEALRPERKAALSAYKSAESQATKNRELKKNFELKGTDRGIWEKSGYKNQEELDRKEKETKTKSEELNERFKSLEKTLKHLCFTANLYSCNILF